MRHYPLDEHAFMEDLKGLVRICSVGQDCGGVTEQAPLGQGIYDSLQYLLELGKRFGFRVKLLDGRCAWIETGFGQRMVAAIGHVDTVPVKSSNWLTDPFDAVVRDGWIYGRGVCDDKGPLLLCLYAMKALAESGEQLNKRVRLIIGGDDESGQWSCMARYRETEELPECGFVPDGVFPVVRAEKGLVHISLFHPYDDECFPFEIKAGYLPNSVPPYAYAVVDGVRYEAVGKSVHAASPEQGLNALLELCAVLEDEGIRHPLVDMMMKLYYNPPWASDEVSGVLTINPAIVEMEEKGLSLRCDLRVPATIGIDRVMQVVRERASIHGFETKLEFHLPPLLYDGDAPHIQKLLHVYRDCTGRDDPLASSGIVTYARLFDNVATFGPLFPGEPNTTHTPGERWDQERMRTCYQIYCNAFREL